MVKPNSIFLLHNMGLHPRVSHHDALVFRGTINAWAGGLHYQLQMLYSRFGDGYAVIRRVAQRASPYDALLLHRALVLGPTELSWREFHEGHRDRCHLFRHRGIEYLSGMLTWTIISWNESNMTIGFNVVRICSLGALLPVLHDH